jgi:transposase-like protein
MISQSVFEQRGGAVPDGAVGGPAGQPAVAETPRSLADLPPPNVKRWTIRRKAAVVTAVANGMLTREEACRRYQLTEEEFVSWQRAYEEHGLPGLRSTRLQQYRGRPRD